MKKVAHLCTAGVSHKILGDKLRLLHESGCDVTLISSPEGADEEARAAYPFRWLFVPMSRSIHPIRDARSIWQMYKLLRRERFDIVHTHTAKAGLIGRIAARLARVPVVIHTSHGLPFYEGQSAATYHLYRWLEKLGALCCDALASQNRQDVSALQRLAPWRKVYFEGNGVDLEKLDGLGAAVTEERLQELRREYGLPEDRPVLLVAARFEPVKDHGLLLDALARLKRDGALDWITVLAGSGPLEAEVRARAQREGLAGDIAFVGQQRAMAPWFKLADAVALTSEKEGIPRSLMEAMAFGKPIVATDVLGTRELVADGVTGMLVPYGESAELAEALGTVMRDAALRSRLGEAGRRRIEAEFTEALVVRRLHAMYRDTAERAARDRRWRARFGRWTKRAIDLAVCVPAVIALLPVYAAVALLVRLKLGSPVLFRQQRPGLYGRPFHVLKFRTMTDATDAEGRPLPDEARLTPFGQLLRKLSLDELPQLFNVIRGDMSLVGPRPLLMEYLQLYTEEQAKRHDVRPGITGWAQVNGRNAVSWEEKFRLDVWYVRNRSLALDLRILVRTVVKVLKREGIQQQGQATVVKFAGSGEMENVS